MKPDLMEAGIGPLIFSSSDTQQRRGIRSRSYPMRKILPMMAILGGVLVLGNVAGHAAPITGSDTVYGSAPIGHLQPRARQFTPQSPAEQAEQQQMSTLDIQQRKEDEELDKRLNICRGC
jgi:hypothetical protein